MSTRPAENPFQRLLKRILKDTATTVTEIGLVMGVSRKTVYQWKSGESIPKPETVRRFCQVLDLDDVELLVGQMKPRRNGRPPKSSSAKE